MDYEGLKVKYNVTKVEDGTLVQDCFVLRPDKDTAAIVALMAYARATDNPQLAADIIRWVGDKQPIMQKELNRYFFFECERAIIAPIKLPKCCWLGGLESDNPTCIQCEKNTLSGLSDQFQICREMNQLLGFKCSGLTPTEVQRFADKIESA